MTAGFRLVSSERFETQAERLPASAFEQLEARLAFLSSNPRHPSLRTHEVKGALGAFGGKIFEAYLTDKYRITWEYGPRRNEIFLRNVDNHDDCLRKP